MLKRYLVSVLLVCLACAEEQQGTEAIPVIETDAEAWRNVPGWKFSVAPLIIIGDTTNAADPTFFDAHDAALLTDGTIVLPTNGVEQRYYRSDGSLLRIAGGKGAGPGEFKSVSYISRVAGDTTATWDWANRRVSFFSPAGEFVYGVDVGRSRIEGGMFGVVDQHRIVAPAYFSGPGPDGDGASRDTLVVLAWARTGDPDTVGYLLDRLIIRDREKGTGYSRATGPSLVASGRRIYSTPGDTDDILVYDNLLPSFILRTKTPQKTAELPRIPTTSNGRLLIDDLGNLWIYNRGLGDRPDYLIYDSGGRLIAWASLPPSSRGYPWPAALVDVVGEKALILDYIEVNTPVVKVYSITRSDQLHRTASNNELQQTGKSFTSNSSWRELVLQLLA